MQETGPTWLTVLLSWCPDFFSFLKKNDKMDISRAISSVYLGADSFIDCLPRFCVSISGSEDLNTGITVWEDPLPGQYGNALSMSLFVFWRLYIRYFFLFAFFLYNILVPPYLKKIKSVVFGRGGSKRERQVKFSKILFSQSWRDDVNGVWKELESVNAVKLLVLGRCVGVRIIYTEAETLGYRILSFGEEVNWVLALWSRIIV